MSKGMQSQQQENCEEQEEDLGLCFDPLYYTRQRHTDHDLHQKESLPHSPIGLYPTAASDTSEPSRNTNHAIWRIATRANLDKESRQNSGGGGGGGHETGSFENVFVKNAKTHCTNEKVSTVTFNTPRQCIRNKRRKEHDGESFQQEVVSYQDGAPPQSSWLSIVQTKNFQPTPGGLK